MPEFRTHERGYIYPIRSGRKGAAVAVAVTIGAGMALGGGVGVSGVPGGANTVARSATEVTQARTAARNGRRDEAWRRMKLRRTQRTVRRAVDNAVDCALHSYGEVREFFARRPCRSLRRALVVVADTDGDLIMVAVAWVRMHRRSDAREFKDLVDTFGTGTVSPIANPILAANGVRLTGQHYASRPAGALVVVAEAEPLGGRSPDELLDAIAKVAVRFPPP